MGMATGICLAQSDHLETPRPMPRRTSASRTLHVTAKRETTVSAEGTLALAKAWGAERLPGFRGGAVVRVLPGQWSIQEPARIVTETIGQ